MRLLAHPLPRDLLPATLFLLTLLGCSATRSPPTHVSVIDDGSVPTPAVDAAAKRACVPAAARISVAADGSGQFTTIAAALDSIPVGNRAPTLISIHNGTYSERFALRGKGFITFHGQDRAKTRIEAEVATSTVCTATVPDDGNGCSVLYVEAQDIAFDNLTIANTWAGSGKAIALRAVNSSTRIVLRDVDLPGKGGDTLMLEKNGLYYLSRVSVAGTYHIIVPRGTTWVADSVFSCLGHPTCLFNEGILDEAQKLVIHSSRIDGDRPFGLGSYFRDAAWYFVDVAFSANLLDAPIWRDPPATPYAVRWGERIYFAGSSGPAYPWLSDNIATSAAQSKERVTLDWVFPEWNPGDSLVCPE